MTSEGPQVCPLWTLIICDRSRILEIPEGGGGAGWSWWPVHAIRSGHTGDKIGRMWGPSRFAFGGLWGCLHEHSEAKGSTQSM